MNPIYAIIGIGIVALVCLGLDWFNVAGWPIDILNVERAVETAVEETA